VAVPQKIALSLLLFGGRGLGCGVGVFLGEALNAAGGVNQLLLAGEKRMAVRADFHTQHVALDGRAGLKRVAAGAVHRNGMIVGMNTGFHEAPFCRVRSARHLDRVGELQPRRLVAKQFLIIREVSNSAKFGRPFGCD
jgi:hypothetical protein